MITLRLAMLAAQVVLFGYVVVLNHATGLKLKAAEAFRAGDFDAGWDLSARADRIMHPIRGTR